MLEKLRLYFLKIKDKADKGGGEEMVAQLAVFRTASSP